MFCMYVHDCSLAGFRKVSSTMVLIGINEFTPSLPLKWILFQRKITRFERVYRFFILAPRFEPGDTSAMIGIFRA